MDESRFRALFVTTYPALARYARHRGLDRDEAEDLIASTFEVAWRRLDIVPEGDEARLWLYKVAFNQLRNLRRRHQRDHDLWKRLPVLRDVEPAAEPGDLTVETICRALRRLSDNDRELLLLIAADGLSPAQAGEVLGCGAVAARTRLHRARRRLSDLLESERHMSRLSPCRHEPTENDETSEISR
ncbi:MAG TPA: RNA polymerase sigma factor [Acidimicrobiales bacterium]|nr:RNA polymerase sigma factor [Acidimicrobiales bacterium]